MRNRLIKPGCCAPHVSATAFPFSDPTWKSVLVAENFLCAKCEVDGPSYGGWPRRDGLPEIETYFDPLIWCLQKRGSDGIVFSDAWKPRLPQADPTFASYCHCPLDVRSISEVAAYFDPSKRPPKKGKDICGTMAFDASGEWAAADCGLLEQYHVLGGTPEFVEQYCETAGGEEYVRAWFYHWDIWTYTDWQDDGTPHSWQKKFYDLVGWPYPIYPKEAYGDSDIDWTPTFGDKIKSCGPGYPDEIDREWFEEQKKERLKREKSEDDG